MIPKKCENSQAIHIFTENWDRTQEECITFVQLICSHFLDLKKFFKHETYSQYDFSFCETLFFLL